MPLFALAATIISDLDTDRTPSFRSGRTFSRGAVPELLLGELASAIREEHKMAVL
jgi:hypothetical protein